jgi:poly-gamma-glutamate synthesis protein (capsule biosynthesis protein)
LAAVGDLMLAGEWADPSAAEVNSARLATLRDALEGSDIVFANLETTAKATEEQIPKQPRLIAELGTLERSLEALRPDIVAVSNNHAFDAYLTGYEATVALLERTNVRYLGAGHDSGEARRHLVTEHLGARFGWLAYTDVNTEPSHVATETGFGVNALDEERAVDDVAALAGEVDHVIVSLHWGVEYCHAPSPEQVRIARRLVDSGARVILGHHAHVVQGIESYGDGVIVYNMGNATTTDLSIDSRLAIKQSRRTRSAFILLIGFSKSGVECVERRPFRMTSDMVVLDDAYARRLVERADRILERATSAGRWQARRVYEDVILRTLWKLDPRVIRSLNAGHVLKLLRNLTGAIGRPARG